MTAPDTQAPGWYAEIDELLAALPGDEPCGASLRYGPEFGAIRLARQADDASLPMGDWERPLKRADWPQVQAQCVALLRARSKDLQLAAWLLEAATVQHQVAGLNAGIALLCGLIERHWEGLHPRLDEDGDCDARVAPLAWLNEALPLTLRLEVTLLEVPGRKPPRLTLDDWERQRRGADEDDGPADPLHALPAREDLMRMAGQPGHLERLLLLREQLGFAEDAWAYLSALVDERLGQDGPSLGRVADALRVLRHTVHQLIAERDLAPEAPALAVVEFSDPPLLDDAIADAEAGVATETADTPQAPTAALPAPAPAPGLSLASREAAYATLEQVADYLQRVEPHSPTPYLIRRAVHWGRLPLPELMQEVMREEGDLNRLFTVLGLAQRQG